MKSWKNSAHSIFMSHVLHSYGGSLAANNGNQVITNMRHALFSKKHGESSLLIIFFAFLYPSYEIVQHSFRPCALDRFFVLLLELIFLIKPSIVILQPSISFPLLSRFNVYFLLRIEGRPVFAGRCSLNGTYK